MRCILQHSGTRNVHVRAPASLIRENDSDLLGDLPLPGLFRAGKARVVILVRNRDVALAGRDRLQLVRVATPRLVGEVRAHALRPGLGLLLAQVIDERAHQREVVDAGGRAHANAPVPFRVGEILVRLEFSGPDLCLVVGDDPGARRKAEPLAAGLAQVFGNSLLQRGREAEPVAVRVAVVGRNARLQHARLERCEHARLLGPPQPADVDGDEHIGRAIGALAPDALQQRVFLALDAVDLDAGLLGEVGVKRFVGLVMPRGVNVYYRMLPHGAYRG